MITKIKNALKTKMKTITGITEDYIYLTAMDDDNYKIQPWASILTQSAIVNKINKKEENLVGVFRVRKYDVVLPLVLAVAGESELQVSAWELALLKALPPYFVVEDPTGQFFASVTVESIQHSDFSLAISDNYQVVFRLIISYGVYVSEVDYTSSPVLLG